MHTQTSVLKTYVAHNIPETMYRTAPMKVFTSPLAFPAVLTANAFRSTTRLTTIIGVARRIAPARHDKLH